VIATPEILELEPHLRTPPPFAVSTPSDGGVDAASLTQALLAAARDHGAEVSPDTAVTGLQTAAGRVVGVESSAGSLHSGTVVLATGTDTPALCAPLGVPLPVSASPAVLVRLTAPPGLVRTIVATPDLEVREVGEGRLLMTVPLPAGADGRDLKRIAAGARRGLASTFQGAEDALVLSVRVGQRPLPSDGGPVIGPLGRERGAYVAVMHSAVTLAPTVGRLVAQEILTGAEAVELRRCRAARFLAGPVAASLPSQLGAAGSTVEQAPT
jgi:glycine/D-amino acid oxidase-like deaminating enzyme